MHEVLRSPRWEGNFTGVDVLLLPALLGDVHSALAHIEAFCALPNGEVRGGKVPLLAIHQPFHFGCTGAESQEEANHLQLLLQRVALTGGA